MGRDVERPDPALLAEPLEGLVVATGVCAVHCRYCFRRHFPYAERGLHRSEREQLVETVREDDTLHEVILSHGPELEFKAPLTPVAR